jgi:mono/diheme cytochrome c family protein
MSGMHGYLRGGILALAASIGLTVPALAQDAAAQLAVGKDAWSRASCQDCHGNMAQGGQGGDSPIGPSLRNIKYDKATMVEIVSCGRPDTPMPAWLKGAYTNVECYGIPLGPAPAGMAVPAILTADEIKALVDYVFATFVQTPQK